MHTCGSEFLRSTINMRSFLSLLVQFKEDASPWLFGGIGPTHDTVGLQSLQWRPSMLPGFTLTLTCWFPLSSSDDALNQHWLADRLRAFWYWTQK